MLTNILSFTFLIIRILIIANLGGYWVYPILSTLSPFYRAFFMVSSCFLVVLTYKMGHFVNHTTWKLKTKLFFLSRLSVFIEKATGRTSLGIYTITVALL